MNRFAFSACCLILALACLTCPAAAQATTPGVELGPPYLAPLHGFSLQPPVNVERHRESGPTKIVSWVYRDPSSGAIAWTLSVLRIKASNHDVSLQVYSQALAEKLRKDEQFDAQATHIVQAAGKEAIDLQGQTTGHNQFYQRQLWVPSDPDHFLVVSLTGPAGQANDLNAIFDAVVATLLLNDPAEAIRTRQESIDRAGQLLAALTPEGLAKAIRTGDQWFIFTIKDKPVGFMLLQESQATEESSAGVAFEQHSALQLPGDQVRLLWRRAFSTADREVESWRDLVQVGEQASYTSVIYEEGLRQADLLMIVRRTAAQKTPTQVNIPEEIQPIYLTRALGQLIPRMILDKTGQPLAFGVYNVEAHAFDLRTIVPLGQESLDQPDHAVQAWHLTDQPAADQEPADVWLDSNGMLLRMQTADGLIMQACTAQQAKAAFPDAQQRIKQMDDLAVQFR